MANPSRSVGLVALVALVAVSAGVGYAVGAHRYHRLEPPGRAKLGAPPPPGLTADVRAALVLPDLRDRTTRVAALLAPLGPEALDEVRVGYDSVVLDTGDVEMVLLVDWWAGFAPQDALEWAHASGIGWHPAVVTAAVRAWARSDPEAASRGLRGLAMDDRLMSAGLLGLVRGWEESGHRGLEDFLERSAGGDEASIRAIDAVARGKVLRDGAEAGIAWAEGLPDRADGTPSDFKLNAYRRVASAIVPIDPPRAAAWVAGLRGGKYASGLLFRTGTTWAEQDGRAAMTWLSTLPADRDLPLAVQETYRTWVGRDREAAFEWLRNADLQPWLDPAVETYATNRFLTSPDEAIEWAYRIHDPRRREQTLIRLAATWLLSAPDEAQAWLDRSDLGEEARQKVAALRDREQARRARMEQREQLLKSHSAPAGAPADR
jgi:hypothetical protein